MKCQKTTNIFVNPLTHAQIDGTTLSNVISEK